MEPCIFCGASVDRRDLKRHEVDCALIEAGVSRAGLVVGDAIEREVAAVVPERPRDQLVPPQVGPPMFDDSDDDGGSPPWWDGFR